ncbi:MAG TPA: hypothetical protein PKD92_11455, partial [Novosphingobium sp.]|nr:hypothetical protein [Novosphingobium sp.]
MTGSGAAADGGAQPGTAQPGMPQGGAAQGGATRSAVVLLSLLLLANILNFIDRHLPFILIDGIKADMGLSDTQLALLTGVSFAGVY